MQRWIIDDTVYSIYGCMDPRSYLHCSAEQMYRFEFKKLLCGLARSLKPADCRYLRYLYSEETALCTISPGDEGSALELVEALERACVVSWERPDRVGEVMRHLGREDCYREVESFVQKHRDEIQRQQLSHTEPGLAALQRDGPGRVCRPIRATDNHGKDDDYCQFISLSQAQYVRSQVPEAHSLLSTPSLEGTSTASSSPESSLGLTREEGEEGIYDYPYATCPILQIVHSKPKPLLEQKMRLLVNPFRHMLNTRQYQMVTSDIMEHSTSKSRFTLRIDPVGYNKSCISAYVDLFEGSQLHSELILQAELTVTHPQKLKRKQSKRASSSVCIHQSTVFMDIPPQLRTGRPSVVARFPHVISHKHLLNEAVIKAPFLELKLLIREHLPAS